MNSIRRKLNGPWAAPAIVAVASMLAIAIVYPGMVFGSKLPVVAEPYGLSDLFDVNLPLRTWGGAALAHGRLPLWYPGCYGGMPLASIPEAVPFYVFSAFFYAFLPYKAATAGTIIVHLVIAGVGAAFLVRHWGAALPGQIMAAVLISAGLHLTAHMRQLNLMQSEAWIAWAWLFWDRLLVRPSRRDAAGLAVAMGMLGLAGHIEVLHHAVVMLAAWGAIRMFGFRTEWRSVRFWSARAAWLAVAAVIGAAIALPHLGPVFEMSLWGNRSPSRYAPVLRTLLMPVYPFILGEPAAGGEKAVFFNTNFAWEQMLYIGVIPLAIAAVHLLSGGLRRRFCQGLLVFAAVGLLLAYAPRLGAPGSMLANLIPLEAQSRFPHRYLWYPNAVLVILAAFGFDGLTRLLNERAVHLTRFARAGLVACIMLAVVADIAWVSRRLNLMDDGAAWLLRPDSLAAIESTGASPNTFGERLGTYGYGGLADRVNGLKMRFGPNPVVDIEFHRFFPGEHPSLWNWPVLRGYMGMTPWWAACVFGDQHTIGILEKLDLDPGGDMTKPVGIERFVKWNGFYGSRWLASPIGLASPRLRLIQRIPGSFVETFVYENLSWPGPAWIAHGVKRFATPPRMFEDMLASDPDPSIVRIDQSVTAFESPVEAGSPGGDFVGTPLNSRPERVVIDCRLAAPGALVLNQNYHPRWTVRVDGGDPRPVTRVNICQMAAWIGAGEHRVVFEYPGTFEKVCLAIGLAGLLAAALCACIPRWGLYNRMTCS